MLLIRVGSTLHLFANDILCLFVSPQPEEDRLTKLVVECPHRKLDLGDQHGLEPLAALHHRRRYLCDLNGAKEQNPSLDCRTSLIGGVVF